MTYVKKAYVYLLLAPALLPLVYLDGIMYPMVAPKTILLRAFALIAAALFAYLAASGQPFFWQRLRQWYAWIPGALLLVAYLTSFIGIDFYHSFWSTFERGDGLLTLTACVLYFYLLLLFADEAFSRRLLKVVAWVGSIAGAYVLLQWVTISLGADLSPIIAKANGRVGGTMGNAAFLAAYLGLSLFVTLAVARDYVGQWRTALYIGAALQLVGILLAATRGTLLALIVVGVLVLLHEAMRGSGTRRTWALRSLAAFGVLILLFFVFNAQLREAPFEPIRRIASISLSDGTVSSRLFLWQNLLPEALKSPLTGVGAEHISVLFNRVYDPTKIVEEWFDRSHNAYLDYLIQFGVIGLALYLALIAVALLTSWRVSRESLPESPWRRYSLPLFAGFAVYALQNFFVFDTGVTLWLLLALIAVLFTRTDATLATPWRAFPSAQYVGIGVGVVLIALLFPVALQPWRANKLAFEAYLYHVVDVPRTAQATEKGLALNTYADLEFGYNAYFMYTNEQLPMLKGEDLKKAYETAASTLKYSHERYPYDARTAVYLLQVLDNAPPGVADDTEFTEQTLAKTISLSPKRAQPWYILANLAIAQAKPLPPGAQKSGLYGVAVKTLQEYAKLVPTIAEPHFVLADLYYAIGSPAKATEEAELGKSLYVPHLLTAKRAAVYYEKVGDWENAKIFLASVVELDPRADTWRYDLAKAKYLTDDFAGAAEIVRYLRSVNPELLATDPAFLAAIKPYE